MYETEVNEGREPAGSIPAEALARFAETRRGLAARVIPAFTRCSFRVGTILLTGCRVARS